MTAHRKRVSVMLRKQTIGGKGFEKAALRVYSETFHFSWALGIVLDIDRVALLLTFRRLGRKSLS